MRKKQRKLLDLLASKLKERGELQGSPRAFERAARKNWNTLSQQEKRKLREEIGDL
jgi:hypothetical protein